MKKHINNSMILKKSGLVKNDYIWRISELLRKNVWEQISWLRLQIFRSGRIYIHNKK